MRHFSVWPVLRHILKRLSLINPSVYFSPELSSPTKIHSLSHSSFLIPFFDFVNVLVTGNMHDGGSGSGGASRHDA